MAIICSSASAATTPATPRSLVSTHHAYAAYHGWRQAAHAPTLPYGWAADRHGVPEAVRWGYATRWWARARGAYARYRYWLRANYTPPASPVGCLAAIHAYFPASAWPEAVAIAQRESGLSPTAKNPSSTASGCFQLIDFWWNGTSAYGWVFNPFDARENVQHAYLIWRSSGDSFCPGSWCQ